MFFSYIKTLFYLIILFFFLYGLINFKTKREDFVDEDPLESNKKDQKKDLSLDKEDSEKDYTLDDASKSINPEDTNKQVNTPQQKILDDEIVHQNGELNRKKQQKGKNDINSLSTDINDNFDSLKLSIAKQMDETKVIIDKSIQRMIHNTRFPHNDNVVRHEKIIKEHHKPSKKTHQPIADDDDDDGDDFLAEEENNEEGEDLNDDESSEDEQEDFIENFGQDDMFKGVASPYCLNYQSL